MDDDFNDDLVISRARSSLLQGAAAAIGLSVLQWCCNPFFIVSIMAAGASWNAVKQPGWMRISLEEDYPTDAGNLSMIAGAIGLILVVLRVGLGLLSILVTMGMIATN